MNFCFIDDGWYNNIIKDGQEIESQECWRVKKNAPFTDDLSSVESH